MFEYIELSNPRIVAEFNDWPYGSLRAKATFTVEDNGKKGMRVARVTVNPKTGKPSKPKRSTYYSKCVIVDGEDGKTYVLGGISAYGQIVRIESNLQYTSTVTASEPQQYMAYAKLLGVEELAAKLVEHKS